MHVKRWGHARHVKKGIHVRYVKKMKACKARKKMKAQKAQNFFKAQKKQRHEGTLGTWGTKAREVRISTLVNLPTINHFI